MNQLKKLFVASFLALASLYTAAGGPSYEINVKPIKGGTHNGPSRPICIPFSCSCDGEGITLFSTANLSAVVEVINEAGDMVASGSGCLNPELIIPLEDFSSRLTIYIVVNEMTYIGYIE